MSDGLGILSYGGGVQTTFMLLSEPERYDVCLFANTGGEWPETIAYIETIAKPFCKQHGIEFVEVKGDKKGIDNLEDFCLSKKIIPSRMKRWCTDDFKKKPIRRYVKSLNRKDVTVAIGFSWDEVERMNTAKQTRLYKATYPLVDQHITRQQCIEGIKKLGYPVPRKSGCFYCPFQKTDYWKELYLNHKDLFKRAEVMEENSLSYGKYTLTAIPLSKLAIRLGEGSAKLEEFMEFDSCETGYCMK